MRFQVALLYGSLEVLHDLSVVWERRRILRKGVIPERHGYVLEVGVQVFIYGCRSDHSVVVEALRDCPAVRPLPLQAIESPLVQTHGAHAPL